MDTAVRARFIVTSPVTAQHTFQGGTPFHDGGSAADVANIAAQCEPLHGWFLANKGQHDQFGGGVDVASPVLPEKAGYAASTRG